MSQPPPERATSADLALPALVVGALLVALATSRWLGTGHEEPSPEPVPIVEAPTPSCEACHLEVVTAWRRSHHARAQTGFDADQPELEGAPEFAVRARPVPVVGRIGVDPLVQWLVDVGGGRVQVTQLALHVPTGELFDVFADGREAGEWGHWTGGGMTWNRSCASCHATEVRKGFDGSGYTTAFSEVGVGCAACHGDVEAHLRTRAPIEHDGEGIDTCAPCHARRAELTDGYRAGAPFLDAFAPVLVDGFEGGLFYGDGQVRDEVFEWTAFASSRMHQAHVRCTDCHDPHGGELVRDGDALCLGCHEALPGFAPHDLHEVGVGCVGCHMPVTTYMQRHPRHDHGFCIPDPVTGAALGIPDACSRCHPDQDHVAAFEAAYGPREVDPRARTFATGEVAGLVAVARDTAQGPLWRASAAARLAGEPEAASVLIPLLTDDDPLVRFGAWSGLGPTLMGHPDRQELVVRGLADPLRAVRVAAARAGAPLLSRSEAPDYVAYLAHNRDQPGALVEDASWALARGDGERALAQLQQALRLDPQNLPALDALAVVWAAAGRGAEAAEALELAVGLAPDDGELWSRLGLARAQAGDALGAETALLRAADLGVGRAHYNLGLLLAQREAYAEALKHLFLAEAAADGVDVRYAIASTLWRWGRPDEARIAAKRVLQLDPSHEGARQMLR